MAEESEPSLNRIYEMNPNILIDNKQLLCACVLVDKTLLQKCQENKIFTDSEIDAVGSVKHQRGRNIKFIELVLKKEDLNVEALLRLLHEQNPHLTKALMIQETEAISPNIEIKKFVEREVFKVFGSSRRLPEMHKRQLSYMISVKVTKTLKAPLELNNKLSHEATKVNKNLRKIQNEERKIHEQIDKFCLLHNLCKKEKVEKVSTSDIIKIINKSERVDVEGACTQKSNLMKKIDMLINKYYENEFKRLINKSVPIINEEKILVSGNHDTNETTAYFSPPTTTKYLIENNLSTPTNIINPSMLSPGCDTSQNVDSVSTEPNLNDDESEDFDSLTPSKTFAIFRHRTFTKI